MKYQVAAISETGNVRKKNEDSILVCRRMFHKKEALLAVVADGMGGLYHGEWASSYVTNALQMWWNEKILPLPVEPELESLCDMLGFVLEKIHAGIREEMKRQQCSMGTTVSLVFLCGNRYVIYQVGDSRIYRISGRNIIQLTKDQTWCQEEYDAGRLAWAELSSHKKSHVLTNAMGAKEDFYSIFTVGQVKHGQRLLLCSDGYYHYLLEKELYRTFFQRNITRLLEHSADRIQKGAAEDNFSAILIEV